MLPATVTRRRLTVEEYHRMGEVGILRADERVELIEGEIVVMAAASTQHMACVSRLNRTFRRLGDRAVVWVQSAIRLSRHSEPEPDIVLLLPRADDYADHFPTAADTLLFIEVADTSLDYDLTTKFDLYAAAGIVETWIADIPNRQLIVGREPSPEGYRQITTLGPGSELAPLAFPDIVVRWADIFGSE